MAFDFSADDVFKMAEQMERNGAEFYTTSAGKASDAQAKELLLGLAGMESEHEKMFASMRARLADKQDQASFYDPGSEAAQYLHALVDTRVFFEKKIDTSTMPGILEAAIAAEKDSIIFYLGMRDLVPSDQGKADVEKIIAEEMAHVRILSKELATLAN